MRGILGTLLLAGTLWLAVAGWSNKSTETLPRDRVLEVSEAEPPSQAISGTDGQFIFGTASTGAITFTAAPPWTLTPSATSSTFTTYVKSQ